MDVDQIECHQTRAYHVAKTMALHFKKRYPHVDLNDLESGLIYEALKLAETYREGESTLEQFIAYSLKKYRINDVLRKLVGYQDQIHESEDFEDNLQSRIHETESKLIDQIDYENSLKDLPEQHRRAVKLCNDGYTYRQIAQKLGISHPTVSSIVDRNIVYVEDNRYD